MSISKGFYSIGEGFASMFSWMYPKSYEEFQKEFDEKMSDLYERNGLGEYRSVFQDEWVVKYSPAQLPDPIQARTPIRCPARKYNRR